MQRRVVAHQGVATLPVDRAVDVGASGRRGSIEAVNDLRACLAYLDDLGRAAVPAERAQIVRLSAAGWVERGSVQNDPAIRGDLLDAGLERPQIGIGRVQQLGVRHAEMVAARSDP